MRDASFSVAYYFLDEGGLGRGRTVQRKKASFALPIVLRARSAIFRPMPQAFKYDPNDWQGGKKHETPLNEVIPTFYIIVYIPRQVTVQNAV